MEDRVTPETPDAGQRRRVVAEPVGQDQRARAGDPAVEPDRQPVAEGLGVQDRAVADLDVRELGELLAAAAAQLRRRDAGLGSSPPIAWPRRAFAGRPVSSTSTRLRARPSTSAALRPAGPPPTITASSTCWRGGAIGQPTSPRWRRCAVPPGRSMVVACVSIMV